MNLKNNLVLSVRNKNIITFSLWKELSSYLLEKKIDQIRPEKQLPWQPVH